MSSGSDGLDFAPNDTDIAVTDLNRERFASSLSDEVPGSEGAFALSQLFSGERVDIAASLHPDETLFTDGQDGAAVSVGLGEQDPEPPLPTTGIVVVQAQPWGDVYVNGNLVGTTPPSVRLEVPAGQVSIEVRNDSAPPHVQAFNIEAGKTVRVNHHFAQ